MLRSRRLRRLAVLALVGAVLLAALLFGPLGVRASRARGWWQVTTLTGAPPPGAGAQTLRAGRIAVLELDDHPAAREVARRLEVALAARFEGAVVERVSVAGAPFTDAAGGCLPDLIALVDRVHADELFLPGYAHQMLRLNVALGPTPRLSSLRAPDGIDTTRLEYSIDGHADGFGLIPWAQRWDDAAGRVAADLEELLDGPDVVCAPLAVDARAPGVADEGPGQLPGLELPFAFEGPLAGEVQELYRGRRASGDLERQWQLTTLGSGVAAIEAAREAALARRWEEVDVARRADGRPRGLSLRSGRDWLHVRPAYMEGTTRDDPDAPDVLAFVRGRVLSPRRTGSAPPPR